ncbi:MAG TPA: DNA primase [Hyphomonadaceae bacterium]|nr:DNA primase [Hyphomonadaceae bacterium]HPI49855.1 DNA primase [Hyphomonadaceae bacterium]
MRFPEEFLNELKSRVRLSDVVGKKVSLKKRGKDWVGLSPFSSEKTPSFYVHDDRGFYKCFSTQKSGDAITFLTETERLTFAEAVEKLARDVGLELPTQSAGEAQQYRKRATLIDWVEKACVFFEDQLRKPAGTEAREYLQKRGFGPEAWSRHRMGFAPDGWRALSDFLTKQGASIEELIEAGLLVQPDDGKQPWDRFRNRVIFPITDHSNRPIAFGARTLEPDGKPKYLNSSDSPLFHKGRTLYRYMDAREALAPLKEGPLSRGLIVTEGYVDAIALAEAGIGTAVAPLGTALTEEQLDLLWRAGPEPILCFDGDAAGIRAAWRACDRALPLIEPGKTLFFVLLPNGMDPDDVVRVRGAQEMRDMLGSARPLVDLLWSRELEAEPLDTPERKAGFEARLMAAVNLIKHPGVKKAYERELKDRLYWHFRPGKGGPNGATGKAWEGKPGEAPHKGQNPGKKGFSPGPTGMAGLGLLVRAIETPELFESAREALAKSEYDDPDIGAIRDTAFDVYQSSEKLDLPTVAAHLRILDRKRAVELLEPFLRRQPGNNPDGAGQDWLDAMERFPVARTLVAEVQATKWAEEEGVEIMGAVHQARIMQKVIARRSASRSVVDEAVTSPASEGAQELRNALGGMGAAMESKRSEE